MTSRISTLPPLSSFLQQPYTQKSSTFVIQFNWQAPWNDKSMSNDQQAFLWFHLSFKPSSNWQEERIRGQGRQGSGKWGTWSCFPCHHGCSYIDKATEKSDQEIKLHNTGGFTCWLSPGQHYWCHTAQSLCGYLSSLQHSITSKWLNFSILNILSSAIATTRTTKPLSKRVSEHCST